MYKMRSAWWGLICELESVKECIVAGGPGVSYLLRMGSVQRAGSPLVFLIYFWEVGRARQKNAVGVGSGMLFLSVRDTSIGCLPDRAGDPACNPGACP